MVMIRKASDMQAADAYEDAIEVYFDPVDEEGSPDCECHIIAVTTTTSGVDPAPRCFKCKKTKAM